MGTPSGSIWSSDKPPSVLLSESWVSPKQEYFLDKYSNYLVLADWHHDMISKYSQHCKIIFKCGAFDLRHLYVRWMDSKFQWGKWGCAPNPTSRGRYSVTSFQIWLCVLKIRFLFGCLFTCLFVPHILPISQKENGPIIIPKTVLKSGPWRGQ